MKNMKIDANGTKIRVRGDVVNENAYISLTDIAKYKNPDNAFIVVANWMRNHSTISFLGLWEQIHNPNFKLYIIRDTEFYKEFDECINLGMSVHAFGCRVSNGMVLLDKKLDLL